jgi:hypothetical protein
MSMMMSGLACTFLGRDHCVSSTMRWTARRIHFTACKAMEAGGELVDIAKVVSCKQVESIRARELVMLYFKLIVLCAL